MAHHRKKNRSHQSHTLRAQNTELVEAAVKPSCFTGVTWLVAALMVGVGVALYGFTLKYPFQFDGESYMLRNPLLKDGGNFFSIFDFAKIRRLVHEAQL